MLSQKILDLVDTLVKKNSRKILGRKNKGGGLSDNPGWGSLDDYKNDIIVHLLEVSKYYDPSKGSEDAYYYNIIKQKVNFLLLKYKTDICANPLTIKRISKLKSDIDSVKNISDKTKNRLQKVPLRFSRPDQTAEENNPWGNLVQKSKDELGQILDRDKLSTLQNKILNEYLAGNNLTEISQKLGEEYTNIRKEFNETLRIIREDNGIKV